MIKFFICFFVSLHLNAQSKKIQHPAAQSEGLTRIDAEGNYIYDVNDELRNNAFHFRIGSVNNPEVSVEINQYNSTNISVIEFDDIYSGASKLSLGFEYEYFFSRSAGRFGFQTGLALQYAEGKGRLATNPAQESIENFNFITMLLYLGLVYRFEYVDRQSFVPYGSGGAAYTVLAEKRDDSSRIRGIGAFGFYAAGGLLFNLSAIDRETAIDFRSEYDISNFWINLEVRAVQVESPAFKYVNQFIQGGFSFDF